MEFSIRGYWVFLVFESAYETNVEEAPNEMIETTAPWYYKALSASSSQSESSQPYQRPRRPPKRITLWNLSTSSDDENPKDKKSTTINDSSDSASESFEKRGLIDISEEYLAELQN